MKKLIAPSFGIILALALSIIACNYAWSWRRSAQSMRSRLDIAKNTAVCQGELSLASAGEQSLPFTHDIAFPKGVTLELRLPVQAGMPAVKPANTADLTSDAKTASAGTGDDPPDATTGEAPRPAAAQSPDDLVGLLHAAIGVIQLYDDSGTLLWEDDFANFVRHRLDDERGEAVMPLRPCAPLAIRERPLGRGRLVVVIRRPVAALASLPLTLHGRHALSGLEELQLRMARIASTLLVVLAALALLWAISFVFRLRRAWHLRHLIQAPPSAGRPILYLLTAYPRWSETFLRQDLLLLQAENLPLLPVALYPGDCECQPGWPKVTLLSDTAPAPGAGKDRGDRWHKLIARLVPNAIHAQLSLLSHRKLRRRLLTECRDKRVGHIHAEFADLAALLAADVAQYLGISYSVGIHAFDIHACKYPRRRLFSPAAFITVCNQAAAQAFRSHCPTCQDRLNVLYHGILLDTWPFQPERQVEGPARLLFIGRLVPKKGIAILLNAISLLKQQHSDVRLTIVGAGPLEDELRTQANTLDLDSLITWTGVLPPDAVRTHIQQASCLCMPSVVTADGDRDGIPNVITEAMASGLPVVGSLFGSLGEVLNPDTGWPVDPLSPEHLAAVISECCAQRDECERRCKNARQLIESRFDARKLASIRADLFRNLTHAGH